MKSAVKIRLQGTYDLRRTLTRLGDWLTESGPVVGQACQSDVIDLWLVADPLRLFD